MNRVVTIMMMVFLAVLCASSTTNAQENPRHDGVTRPAMVPTGDSCMMVAEPGNYVVQKGELVEIDFQTLTQTGCGPHGVIIATTYNGVLKPSKIGPWFIATDAIHYYTTSAYFFRAHKRGHDTITLTIDGVKYIYEIEVG